MPMASPSTWVSSRPRLRRALRRLEEPAPGASDESAASSSSGTVCRIRSATSSKGSVREATSSGGRAGGWGSSAPRSASHCSRSLFKNRRCPPAVRLWGTFPPAAHARRDEALTPRRRAADDTDKSVSWRPGLLKDSSLFVGAALILIKKSRLGVEHLALKTPIGWTFSWIHKTL